MKCLTFAPLNSFYRTGVQLLNLDSVPINVTMYAYQLGNLVTEETVTLQPMRELLFMIDQPPLSLSSNELANYALFFNSDGKFNPFCCHVDLNGGLFFAPTIDAEVPTQQGN